MDKNFDHDIGVGEITKVSLEQIARFNEAMHGIECDYIDRKIVSYSAVGSTSIGEDGVLVHRVWVYNVNYVPVDSKKKYLLVKIGNGKVIYTDDIQDSSPDDHIIPVLDFPTDAITAIKKAFEERGIK